MSHSLFELFSMLNNHDTVRAAAPQDLFGFEAASGSYQYEQAELDFIAGYFSGGFSLAALKEATRAFFELSVNAFDTFVCAWMSEMPVEAEIVNFGRGVIAAADACGGGTEEKRQAAERAACDRSCEGTLTVLNAALKVQKEIDRMRGLMRFFPDTQGVYIAKCAPDTLVLPALGGYFTARFGETAWVIIDEKRGLCLHCNGAEGAKIQFLSEKPAGFDSAAGGDEWEELWKHYHKTINNESRNNPDLQRQFLPQRYWKYLPEIG